MPTLARWCREPLVHFILLGALILALHHALGAPATPREIVVSASLLRGLRSDHERRTGAAPTAEEEKALVARFLDDEVLYREALALGLDRGDVIIRRRLIQKMQYLTEDLEPVAEPSDADLEAWLAAHQAAYVVPLRVSLEQVFVAGSDDGGAARVAAELHSKLAAGADPRRLGDPFLRGREFRDRTEQELARVFGSAFAARTVALPAGAWSEPLRSSYGLHLVRVTERFPAHPPALAEVRAALRRDWMEARREASNRAALDHLHATYAVSFEGGGAVPAALAAAR